MHCDRSQKTVIANGWHWWLGQTKTQDYSTLNRSCTAFFFFFRNTITLRNFSNSASILMSWSNADANCSYVHCLQSTGTKHSQRASTYCWETCGQTNEIFNKEYASCEFNCILIYQALAKIWLWHNLHRRLAFLYFYYSFLNKNALFHLHAQSSIWLLMCKIFTFVCNRYNEHKFQYKQRKVRRFMCGNLAFHSMCRGLLSKP